MSEVPDYITYCAASTARQLVKRYRDYVEWADVQQECLIWWMTHREKVAGWEEEHEPKSVQRLVSRSMRNHGDKYARREKAARVGYDTDDEFFYSIGMVTDMLQLYFDPDWTAPRGFDTQGPISGGKPASEGWNLQTMVADVGKAYESMSQADRDLIEEVYGGQRDPRDAMAFLALGWGVSQTAAYHRVRRVVGRIRAALGGPRPYEEVS